MNPFPSREEVPVQKTALVCSVFLCSYYNFYCIQDSKPHFYASFSERPVANCLIHFYPKSSYIVQNSTAIMVPCAESTQIKVLSSLSILNARECSKRSPVYHENQEYQGMA